MRRLCQRVFAARLRLKGFPDAIEAVFPKTAVQLCLVLYLQGAMVCGALFQPLVVAAHGIGELQCQTQVTGRKHAANTC